MKDKLIRTALIAGYVVQLATVNDQMSYFLDDLESDISATVVRGLKTAKGTFLCVPVIIEWCD